MWGGKLFKQFPKEKFLSMKDAFISDVGTNTASTITARYYKGIANHKDNMVLKAVSIPIKEAVAKGYSDAHVGDSINLAMPNSQTRRGRVGEKVAQTLDTQCNQGTLEVIKGSAPSENQSGMMVELAPNCHVYAVWYEKYQCYIAIRRLTPKECFRLQGWTDDYFEKAQFVNSDSQLYKQAGNGVTINCVNAIGKLI